MDVERHKQSSECGPLTFMRLPLEVRDMIYQQLVQPRSTVPARYSKPKKTRCPPILLVCRIVYKEAVEQWYFVTTLFEAKVNNNGADFLGRHTLYCIELPPTGRRIRRLHLTVNLEWRPSRMRLIRDRIQELFPHDHQLQHLEIDLLIKHPLYSGLWGIPSDLEIALKGNLARVQELVGIPTAKIRVTMGSGSRPTDETLRRRFHEELYPTVEKYFHNFDTEWIAGV